MSAPQIFLFSLYAGTSAFLFCFGLNCYVLTSLFLRRFRVCAKSVSARSFATANTSTDFPKICIQLPIYNEMFVVARLLDTVSALEYPRNRLEIQILDDSDDETSAIIAKKMAQMTAIQSDLRIEHIRRGSRLGYKAGALRHGMEISDAAFFAIFDADFVPSAGFLRNMLPPLLSDPQVGFTQARWGHLNADHSLLTQAIAVGIDGHFVVEQSARAWNGLLLNFNGTAGIFRREAIEQAGNWQDDTLTEDLDLSYRVQLAGYRGVFVFDEVVPAEIPTNMCDFKTQQFRWAKGSIETAIKLLPALYKAKLAPFTKLQAFLHLTHYAIHPAMLVLAVLSLPVLLAAESIAFSPLYACALALLALSIIAPTLQYLVAIKHSGRTVPLYILPLLTVIGVGIALSNTKAVIAAIIGQKTSFLRTPKHGSQPSVARKTYRSARTFTSIGEGILGVYCAFSCYAYVNAAHYAVLPFVFIYAAGFLFVASHGVAQLRR